MQLPSLSRATLLGFVAFALGACGPTFRTAEFEETFAANDNLSVEIGTITNSIPAVKRDAKEGFDIVAEMRDQLTRELEHRRLLANSAAPQPAVRVDVAIIDYEPGSAFGRWIGVGVGDTVLSVECPVSQSGKRVGLVRAMRRVNFGGFYSVGQWKTVFKNVAKDVAKELDDNIRP